MDDHWASLDGVVEMDPLPEVEQCGGVVGHTVIRPLEEMELLDFSHRHLGTALPGQLRRRRRRRWR